MQIQLPESTSNSDLRALIHEYNWDDGFDLPQAIADHPNCDLSLALELFWLADADEVYLGDASEHSYNARWRTYCHALADRLLAGHYKQGTSTFHPPLTRTQAYKLRKRGLPELFLTDVGATSN